MGWRIPSLSKSHFLNHQLSHLAIVHDIHLAMATKPPQLINNIFFLSDYLRNFFLHQDWLSGDVSASRLGTALLFSSRAGSDLGLVSRLVWGLCQLGSSSQVGTHCGPWWGNSVSDTCHLAPCYLNRDEVFLLLSDQYHNPEQGFEPGT